MPSRPFAARQSQFLSMRGWNAEEDIMNSDSQVERLRLTGAMTALVTPFKDGNVDYDAIGELAEWHIQSGISALVACGTTGEASTLTWDERLRIIRTCLKVSNGRVPIIAGTGTSSTELTIAHTSAALSCGADAALIVTPFYNRPNQDGIVRHFEAIAARVPIPVIVYNVPSRTGVDISLQSLDRLSQMPSILGIKDATGDVRRVEEMRNAFGDRFILLSGHDASAHAFNLLGGDGMISVMANVLPHVFVALQDACIKGDWPTAKYIHQRLKPVLEAFELDTNPCPIKAALKHRRGMRDEVRLPLITVADEVAAQIASALDHLGGVTAPDHGASDDAAFNLREKSPVHPAPLAWRV